jgi:hypothetical protein
VLLCDAPQGKPVLKRPGMLHSVRAMKNYSRTKPPGDEDNLPAGAPRSTPAVLGLSLLNTAWGEALEGVE